MQREENEETPSGVKEYRISLATECEKGSEHRMSIRWEMGRVIG